MKRVCCFLLCSGLLLCGEGCKRSSSTPKPALMVSHEVDFLYAGDFPSSPKGLTTDQLIERMKMTPQQFDAARKKNLNKIDMEKDTLALGKAFADFRRNPSQEDAGPPDDNAKTRDRFESFLRRLNQTAAYEKLIDKQMDVTFLYFSGNPTHILAWHNKIGDSGGEVADYLVGSASTNALQWTSPTIHENSLHLQELQVVWRYAAEFCLSHYTSVPLQTIKQKLNTDPPARILAWIKQTQPQSIKNPPEPRSMESFVAYLKENVSPEVAKPIVARKLRVNLNANLWDDGDWFVCHGATKTKKDKNGLEVSGPSGGSVKLHPTLHCDGRTIGSYEDVLINQKFK